MTDTDKRYLSLYVARRRLMTLNARENRDSINTHTVEIDALRASGGVSEAVIRNAAWVPWR
jgi:hypothetical protein